MSLLWIWNVGGISWLRTPTLLGSVPADRGVAIMVTMPSEAAVDYSLVQHLVEHGMDCMRINCAHDDDGAWARMIEHLRRAELATGRACRVLMDLAGPKLRTGPLEPGPCVVKVRPRRDVFGRVTHPRADLALFAGDTAQTADSRRRQPRAPGSVSEDAHGR